MDQEPPVSDDTSQTELHAAAAEWFLRLREPDVSPADVAGWIEWYRATSENRRAFEHLQTLWSTADHALALQWPTPSEVRHDRYTPDRTVEEWFTERRLSVRSLPTNSARLQVPIHQTRRRWRTWHPIGYVGGAVAAVATFAIVIWHPWRAAVTSDDMSVSTLVGVTKTMRLVDGTRVTLGGASSISLRYSVSVREVVSLEGEAFFQVTKDIHRPFLIRLPGGTFRAVGTAFDLRAEDGQLRLTVTEGVVEVAPQAQAAPAATIPVTANFRAAAASVPLRLAAGQQLTIRLADAVVTLVQIDPSIALGWLNGRLSFIDEPLTGVLATIGRYSTRRIVISDFDAQHLTYTGTVVPERIDEWLAALPRVFPVKVEGSPSATVITMQSSGELQAAPAGASRRDDAIQR
ncbi:MAG TPA: FecR domain-containing protein [Steroidobacteraceae bacterium]|jgi:transmembrane sensor|nr:FecR domain-containing protein [Steroidobacteraceae bacterium]